MQFGSNLAQSLTQISFMTYLTPDYKKKTQWDKKISKAITVWQNEGGGQGGMIMITDLMFFLPLPLSAELI